MKKNTKRSLLLSVLALILCCALLAGTTLAWFTDTASSGVNKIQAGNLDIVVDYNVLNDNGTLTDNWKSLDSSTTSLFNKDLWEPGHTEIAVIRIKNAGNLSLKYQAKVDVVAETGSINVEGKQFKLSDYLMYGVAYDTAETSLNRAEAIAKSDLPFGTYTPSDRSLLAKDQVEYMTIAITMPTTVGNEANYDKQYNAPSIDLGIEILATQVQNENDSFGNDYDANAQYSVPNFITSTNVVFPVKNKETLATGAASVTIPLSANTSAGGTYNMGAVTVPAGRIENPTEPVTVEVKPAEQGNFSAAAAGKEVKYYEITVTNLKDGTDKVEVKLQLDKGLTDVVIQHDKNGTPEIISPVTYDSTTGIAKFQTDSFSPFAVEYKCEKVAKIGDVYYSSLADAFAAVKSGETITLLKNAKGNGVVVPSDSNFTVDFNGFSYDIDGTTVGSAGTETNGFQLLKDSTIIFKNGSLTSNKAKILIQNYSNLTLDNMKVSAGSQCGYVVSNNNGNVVIKDTTINAADGKVAFDVYSFVPYTGSNVTVKGKSVINGNIEVGCDENADTSSLGLKIESGIINGKITVKESLKKTVSITGGTFSADPNAYVVSGKGALWNGEFYVVIDGAVANNQKQANDAIKNATDKKVTISIAPGQTITLNNDIANGGDNSRDVTFVGDGSQTVDVAKNAPAAENAKHLNYQRGSKFTFENLTIENGIDAYDGIVCDELTYKNCTIKGVTTLYGNATFINCTFENTMADQYSIWTWGGTDVKFEGCTFNTNGKAILLYGGASASNPTNLVVNNCTFNDRNNGTAGKAAIEIGNDYNATYTLTVNHATVNGFADGKNTGSKLWANKNSMDAAHLTVTIDGTKVQ